MGCSSSVHAAPPAAQSAASGEKPQPVTPDSRVLRGQAYYTAGKVQEALKEFNATIAQWPTYARAYLERGNVRLDQKEFNGAVGDYTLALQLQGNLLQAYVMRCHARMAMRQWSEALGDVREAERLDPENAQVRALKIQKLCMVCMDAERECRLRPCMHAALCVECAEGLMARGYSCPICSCKIEQSPLGRRFAPPGAQGAPSLDNIAELNPHPLAARANTATRNIAAELEQAAAGLSGPSRGNSGDQTAAAPPPLPGVVEDGSEGMDGSSGSQRTTAAADGVRNAGSRVSFAGLPQSIQTAKHQHVSAPAGESACPAAIERTQLLSHVVKRTHVWSKRL
eukprot:XP_001698178.1 predicted protein [Chlamydomonas reinhardtii]